MKCGYSIMALLGILCLSGCRQVSDSATIPPQQLISQAAQAMVDNQYQKARSLFDEVVRLDPDFAEAWVGQGQASALLGDIPAARKPYERAVLLHAQRYRKTPGDSGQLVQQVYVLFLLGRDTEGRDLLTQGLKAHPADEQLNAFSKEVDGLLSDKEFLKVRAKK